jgi:hypothetical protein
MKSLAVEAGPFERTKTLHSKRTSSDSSINSMEVVVQDDDEVEIYLLKNAPNEIQEPDDFVSAYKVPLSDAWSIDMFQNAAFIDAKDSRNDLLEQYSFRLVRNSEPQSALYLHGAEVFDSMEAVWEINTEATFFIYPRANGCHCEEEHPSPPVPISFDVRSRMRFFLYRMMWQMEFPGMHLEKVASLGIGNAGRCNTATQQIHSVSSLLPKSVSGPASSLRRQRDRLLWLDLCEVTK